MKSIVSLLLAATAFSGAAQAQLLPSNDRHLITVTGEALVNVAPDRILVTFGVDTRADTLAPAKQENDAIMRKVLAAIRAMDVRERDIQTDRVSIQQRFENNGRGGQVLVGYTARNMFVVTVRDSTRVDALISAALDAGANYLLDVEFQTTELRKHREQARDMAVRAAREKAERMAAVLGDKVGRAVQVDEEPGFATMSHYFSWSGNDWGAPRGMNMASQNVMNEAGASEAGDTIALGNVGVRARVRVVFELVD